MTWLAPLYLAGALAIAAPLLFHLWRRTPRGRRTFSTLMFLTPSPPRVTSISRVEHWLLLLLRAAALALIALAFSRPVLRIPTTIPQTVGETEFVAVLLDTSASLQRTDLWPKAQQVLADKLKSLPETAVVGLFHFDDVWSTDVSFSTSAPLDPAVRRPLVQEQLQKLQPTWRGTKLGDALVRTAQAIQEAQTGRAIPAPQRVWLVSDLQAGSDLAALREFDWPDDLPVEWLPVENGLRENAGLQLVTAATERADEQLRVRVSNAASSSRQQFTLVWGDASASPCLDVVVPPGQSRVVVLPAAPSLEAGRSVVLRGDDEPFDNRLWLPVRQPRQCVVVYLGTDTALETDGLRYYLDRALASNPRYEVSVVDGSQPILSTTPPTLVVVSDATPEARELLPKLLAAGTDALLVPRSAEVASTLAEWCGLDGLTFVEADGSDYALWSEIDFESPWFAPFAEAQFSDFSGIHFWKHRQLQGELSLQARVLVRFDNRVPAVVQWSQPTGTAKLWYFAAGWHPRDSQLSRSSKFVPLMWSVLEGALGDASNSSAQSVGQPIRRPARLTGELAVRLPDGQTVPWPAAEGDFRRTEDPGRYEVVSDFDAEVIAINIPPEESRTDPVNLELLEAAGVKLSSEAIRPTVPTSPDLLRQQQVQELEERQQLWKWLLLAAGGLLMVESWLGGRRQQGAELTEG